MEQPWMDFYQMQISQQSLEHVITCVNVLHLLFMGTVASDFEILVMIEA